MSDALNTESVQDSTVVFKRANVWVGDRHAGVIEEYEGGFCFTYAMHYLSGFNPIPVSLTLPLRAEPYTSKILFPFFDGLIPEGWLLDVAVKTWKMDLRDRMELLINVCEDCIGSVSVVEISRRKEVRHGRDGK